MRLQHLGMLVLGILLIAMGVLPLAGYAPPAVTTALAGLAIVAGLILLYERYRTLASWF